MGQTRDGDKIKEDKRYESGKEEEVGMQECKYIEYMMIAVLKCLDYISYWV